MASVKDAQRQLLSIIRAGINDVIIALEGPAGLGKSAVIGDVGRILTQETGVDHKVINLRLAQMVDSADITGIPYTVNGRTDYATPYWWPEEGTKGILFLDEPNRAEKGIRQGVFQLLDSRRIGKHVLPDGWFITLAFNPSEGEVTYDVEQTDPAWNTRFLKLEITPNVDAWLEWAATNNINDLVRRYIATQPKMIHIAKDTGSFPCPRTWEKVSKLLNSNVVLPELQGDLIAAAVGFEAAASFISFMDKNYKKPVCWADVVKGYVEIDGQKKSIPDAIKEQQTDENGATINEAASILNTKETLTDKEVDDIMIIVTSLTPEMQLGFLKKLSAGKNGNKKLGAINKRHSSFTVIMEKMLQECSK